MLVVSRSATLSSDVWTCSAFCWASVTFFSASSIKRLNTSYGDISDGNNDSRVPYLDGSNIGILRDVLILVQTILCRFSLSEVDT